jgi:prolipoprotein diacylglyceryltransferase
MNKLINLKTKNAIMLYLLIDIICAGMGMGVPFFCILLGFPVGWYITKRSEQTAAEPSRLFYDRIFKSSLWTTVFTFLLMVVIWGRIVFMFFDPQADFQNFGHPFILYDPKISLVAWLMLMILISPFLQLLTTIFAAFITLMRIEAKKSIHA